MLDYCGDCQLLGTIFWTSFTIHDDLSCECSYQVGSSDARTLVIALPGSLALGKRQLKR